jgi:hypothetical protein
MYLLFTLAYFFRINVMRKLRILSVVIAFLYLSCVATSVLRMRLLHAVAFSKKLPWLAQTKVITSKTKTHAVNAR